MKKVYFIRHAKSSWKDETLDDFDRPLNKRGKKNAPMMGDRLNVKGVQPDIILSSPALRAKTTAEEIATKVCYDKDIVFYEDLYDAFVEDIEEIIKELDNEIEVAFLFGHNPDLYEVVQHYVGFDKNIPTCGIVEIEFDCDIWSEISMRNAKLISFDYPKKVEGVEEELPISKGLLDIF